MGNSVNLVCYPHQSTDKGILVATKKQIDKAGNLATLYSRLRKEEKELEKQRKDLYNDVIEAMEKAELEKVITEHGSLRLYHRDLRTFDSDQAKKVLGEKLFSEITIVRIDVERLEAMIKLGEIDPRLVDKFTTIDHKTELRLY